MSLVPYTRKKQRFVPSRHQIESIASLTRDPILLKRPSFMEPVPFVLSRLDDTTANCEPFNGTRDWFAIPDFVGAECFIATSIGNHYRNTNPITIGNKSTVRNPAGTQSLNRFCFRRSDSPHPSDGSARQPPTSLGCWNSVCSIGVGLHLRMPPAPDVAENPGPREHVNTSDPP